MTFTLSFSPFFFPPFLHTCIALQFQTFDFELARKIGENIQDQIKSLHEDTNGPNSTTALISIRLWSGLTLLQNTYGSGVTVSNEDWARRKANTGKSDNT